MSKRTRIMISVMIIHHSWQLLPYFNSFFILASTFIILVWLRSMSLLVLSSILFWYVTSWSKFYPSNLIFYTIPDMASSWSSYWRSFCFCWVNTYWSSWSLVESYSPSSPRVCCSLSLIDTLVNWLLFPERTTFVSMLSWSILPLSSPIFVILLSNSFADL